MTTDGSQPRAAALDWGRPLEFGFFLDPAADDPTAVLDTARLLDRLGYDLIGIQDHPYQARHLDTLSLLGVILGQTSEVRVFADVHDLPLRPPAVLGKAAATLDLLSGGRFEIGLGAGGFLQAAHAMGAQQWTPGQSLAALEEAVTVIRAMWSGKRGGLQFDGRFYRLGGVHPGPAPAHPIPIWIGANKPRALALTGRIGDGWVSPLMGYKPPFEAAEANRVIDRAATEAGRNPADIRRIYNIQGAFTHHRTQGLDADGDITGPPEEWADVLTHFALDLGFDTFVLAADNDEGTLTTFITEVAPAVRARVAEARAHSPRESPTERRRQLS
jgi:alkanesulfonate monooxygenase SsuD/methylene tetrahydromethanopterin reductase-like flavin-dependent oxidoreductase (luciferase family)